MIGQEAILELEKFNLEGRDKKSLRNGLNSLQKKGFTCVINKAPHKPEFLSELKKCLMNGWKVSAKENTFFRRECSIKMS